MTDPPNPNSPEDEKPPETEASSIEDRYRTTQQFTKGAIGEPFPAEESEAELYGFVEAEPNALCENVAPPTLNGDVWEVVVIREGVSLNNRYYSRPVLEASLPVWESAEVRVYGWTPGEQPKHLDHVPADVEEAFPDGTFLNRAGFLRNVQGRVNEADGRYEVVAEFAVTDKTLRADMLETHRLGGPLPGFSIHAFASAPPSPGIHEGRRCLVIPDIAKVHELTIVSKPAAGGRALRLVAAETSTNTKENQMNLQNIRAFVAGRQPKAMAGIVNAMEAVPLMEAAAELLTESNPLVKFALELLKSGKAEEAAQALEMALSSEEPAPADDAPSAEDLAPMMAAASTESAAEVRALREAFELERASRVLDKALTEAALPEIAEKQLRKAFANRVFKEADLAAAISEKRELLAINAGGRAVVESAPRNPHVNVMLESADKTQIGLNLMMGVDYDELLKSGLCTEAEKRTADEIKRSPNLIRPRRLYQEMSGDWGMRMNARVSEAVTSSTYSNALGTSINLVLAQAQRTRLNPGWENIILQEDSDNLLDETNIIMGGYDILPTVSEGANYTDLGNPKEYSVSLSIAKRGGYVSITEEAIINDRIGAFEHLRNSARDAGFSSLDNLAWAMVTGAVGGTINGDTSYDGTVIYHANHFNTATTAFSQSALAVAHRQQANTFKVAFVTALNDGTDINSSDTTVTVDDATGIQVGAYIRLESEIMKVTAVSSNDLTVTRGVLGTTAASHVDNTVVVCYGGQLELGQSTAMGWGPELYIIAPNELRSAVYETLGSQYVSGAANFNANYFQGMYQDGLIKPIFVPAARLGDSNNWYTAVPYQLSPTLKIRYFNGQRAPQVVDETPLSGDHFLADKMKFRLKFRFGGKALGHEGRTGNIVSGT